MLATPVVMMLLWALISVVPPVEEPASGAGTPNPSKAPWQEIALQEALVYADPIFAGLIAPVLVPLLLFAGITSFLWGWTGRNPASDEGESPRLKKRHYIFSAMLPLMIAITAYLFAAAIVFFLRAPDWMFAEPL